MKLNRIRFSPEVSAKLSQLKGRTGGITPNILCRIAFCLSVEEPNPPDFDEIKEYSSQEIDRHVLLGTWDQLFVSMLKERCKGDGVDITDEEILAEHFRAHVYRGVHLLHKRVKSLSDMIHLMPKQTV